MEFSTNHHSSNGLQSQPEALPLISTLLTLPDPTAFLTKYVEALHLSRQIQKEQVEAEASRQVKAENETEAKACNRLIAIILEHAKRQGVNPCNLPNLKRKNYEQLCTYINENWTELSIFV